MNEIYPVEGKNLPDLPEPWHWKRAGSALATGFLGIALASGYAVFNLPSGLTIAFGILLLLVAIAASVVTRFWTQCMALGGATNILAWAAVIPGAILLFVWYYILYVFWLIIVAVFSG